MQQLHHMVLQAAWLQPLLDNIHYTSLIRLWQAHAVECLGVLLRTHPEQRRQWHAAFTTACQVLMNAPDVQHDDDLQEKGFVCNRYCMWELDVDWVLRCLCRHVRDSITNNSF